MQQHNGYFVTGTDTEVGKTFISSLLMLRLQGIYWKPLQTGDDDDTATVMTRTGLSAAHFCKPALHLPMPAAPYTAAQAANTHIDTDSLTLPARTSNDSPWIVEGAGGLLVPITRTFSMLDLARQCGLPVLIVAANRLGVLNHTLLTCAALKQAGLSIAGIILNGNADDPLNNYQTLRDLTDISVTKPVPTLPEDAELMDYIHYLDPVLRPIIQQ